MTDTLGPVLRTARLVLRPYTRDDVEAAFRWATSPDFSRFTPLPSPYTRNHAEEHVAAVLARDPEGHPTFAITLDGGFAIGDVSLHLEPDRRRGELGYGLGHEWWSRGYMAEAAGAVVLWAFETLAVEKIEARTDARNLGSWRVMEKVGMVREGLLRRHRFFSGEAADELRYGILREEVLAARGQA